MSHAFIVEFAGACPFCGISGMHACEHLGLGTPARARVIASMDGGELGFALRAAQCERRNALDNLGRLLEAEDQVAAWKRAVAEWWETDFDADTDAADAVMWITNRADELSATGE